MSCKEKLSPEVQQILLHFILSLMLMILLSQNFVVKKIKCFMQFRTRQLIQNKNLIYVILLFLPLLLVFLQEKNLKA